MPIADISDHLTLWTNLANNLTTNDQVIGINVKLGSDTTLSVNVYNIVIKAVVRSVMSATEFLAGTHSIDFDAPVELGENELIAVSVTSSALKENASEGVGYYSDGTLVAGKEVSYSLKTFSKGLQAKVEDVEDRTKIIPTLKDNVLGKDISLVPIGIDVTSFASATNSTVYWANRLITDKKILGIRLYCLKAATDSVSVGLFDYNTISVTDVKTSLSVAKGINNILFDTPIYLKPNQLVAVKSSTTWVIGQVSNVDGVVGMYHCNAHEYVPRYCLSYELIVEDDGLIGDVAELEMIPTRNKSWCSVGTSITHANGRNDILMGYQDRVMQKITFSQFTNVGVAGQAIATGAKGAPVPSLAEQVDTMLTTIADYYTIEHGINDWNRCTTIGTIDDFINNTGYATFYGAYRVVIDKIYTLNPNAKIILITPRKAYGASVFREHWWEANTAGGNDYYLKNYVAAVRAIGEFLSLPVCDWFADSNTNQYNLAADSVDVALHPNDTGYQKLANLLVQTFLKVID